MENHRVTQTCTTGSAATGQVPEQVRVQEQALVQGLEKVWAQMRVRMPVQRQVPVQGLVQVLPVLAVVRVRAPGFFQVYRSRNSSR